jgi:hypothetical protein
MRFVTMLCCLALLVFASEVTAVPAEAATVRAGVCTLPTYRNHTPHPVLTARMNKDRTVSFNGTTCPWAFIAVFQVHGKHLRNNVEDLVCDALPDRKGHFSCSSLKRYGNGAEFGVTISGQFVVAVSAPGTPRPRVHRKRASRHAGPNTGLGGLARLVAQHHPWPAQLARRRHARRTDVVRPAGVARHCGCTAVRDRRCCR